MENQVPLSELNAIFSAQVQEQALELVKTGGMDMEAVKKEYERRQEIAVSSQGMLDRHFAQLTGAPTPASGEELAALEALAIDEEAAALEAAKALMSAPETKKGK